MMKRFVLFVMLLLLTLSMIVYGKNIEGQEFKIVYPQDNKIGSLVWDKEGMPLDRVEEIMSSYDARWSALEYSRVYEGGDIGEVYIDTGILKESDNRIRMSLDIERFMEMWVQQEAESTRRLGSGSNFGGHDGKFYELRGTKYSAFAGYWFLDNHRIKIVCMKIRTSHYGAVKVAAFKCLDEIVLDEAKETPEPTADNPPGGADPKALQRLAIMIGGPTAVIIAVMLIMVDHYKKKSKLAEKMLTEQAEVAKVPAKAGKKGVHKPSAVEEKISHSLISEDKGANVKLNVTSDTKTILADGKSKSMIKVRLTTISGDPIDGKKVLFSLGDEGKGRLTSESALVKKGEFFNFYTSGTEVGTQMVTATLEENPRIGETIVIQLVKIETITVDGEKPRISAHDKKGLKIKATLLYSDGSFAVDEVVRFRVLEGDGRVTPAVKINNQGFGEAIFWPGGTPGKVVLRGESASTHEVHKIVEIELTG